MSILIKGIEMPKSCEDCKFCIGLADTEWGMCAGCLIDDEYREASSKSGCPLVEVPTPHGRLIDADALDYKLSSSDRDIYVRGVLEEEAPTIIEAEGEENV